MELGERRIKKMDEYGIPKHMQGGIIRYYENGIEPGHFLTAVINNDLRGAIERADDINVNCLKAYVMWFYNHAPGNTWGHANATREYITNFRETKEVAL